METAYSILHNHLTLPYWLSLLIVFIATLAIWRVVEKRQMVAGRTCGNEKKWTHSLLISLFVTYIFFILLITLIARTPADTRHIKLVPFWSWYEVIVNGDRGLAVEIGLNVVLFLPVGILSRLQGVKISRMAIFSLCLSLFIEVMQYFTCRGLMEWDDVFGNTCGAVIGYWCYGYVMRISRREKN
ncbi:MAG: VanZ family protein [Lachnospiraceae bacterium]|nr:VanZ family protein [Lachnospiraceae bacterium]